MRLPKSARSWLMRVASGSASTESTLYTSDYPRVLQYHGLLVRHGDGGFLHDHRLSLTQKGVEVGLELLVERLLGRPVEGRVSR